MFFAFFSALFLSIVFTFFIKKLAWQWKVLDYPHSERKIHKAPVPLLGGGAIFLSFTLVSAFYVFFTPFILGKYISLSMMVSVWLAGFVLMVGGAWDDKKNLPPLYQFFWPVLAIFIILLGGIKINYFTNPLGGVINLKDWAFFSYLLTFFWLLGLSYTTKILDGLDGLTAGVSLIGSLIILAISLWVGPAILPEVGYLAVIFSGALLGFLFFNWHPASIFLGEGGSIYCGLLLGVLAIITDGKIAVTLLVMAIPIIDLFLVILKRLKEGKSPFHHADKKHLHFQLLKIGFTHRESVLLWYSLTAFLGVLSLLLKSQGRFLLFLTLFILMIGVGGGLFFRKRKIWLILVLAALLIIGGIGYWRFQPSSSLSKGKIIIDKEELTVEIAKTPSQWRQGLSGRKNLGEKEGMLFIFPRPDYYPFWMKGMLFPLDIIWIKDNQVVEIVEDASPPQGESIPTYYPSKKAEWVLEVPAGFCQKNSIYLGTKVFLFQ